MDRTCELAEGEERDIREFQHRDSCEGGEECREAGVERDVCESLGLRSGARRLGEPWLVRFGEVRYFYLEEVGELSAQNGREEGENARGVVQVVPGQDDLVDIVAKMPCIVKDRGEPTEGRNVCKLDESAGRFPTRCGLCDSCAAS